MPGPPSPVNLPPASQPVGMASHPVRSPNNHYSNQHHHRVGSLVCSLGRQGFQLPLSKREREQAKTLVFSDRLDDHNEGATSANIFNEFSDEDDDGAILEEGVGAPSESQRVLAEQRDLLRESASHHPNNNYGSIGSQSTPNVIQNALDDHRADNEPFTENGDYPGWEEALIQGKIETSIALESKTLCSNSIPLAITFILQYSLIMASLFSVGHSGKVESGAVSLGGMTASITGVAFIQGMSTCLDTLCSQAYGAGRPDLVGLYFQKGVSIVMLGLLPVSMMWYRADYFLPYIVADEEEDSARLVESATLYLRIMIFAMPGFCLFECGKRFMQAQDIFHASTMVSVLCAPLNILITYTLVWSPKIGLGFIGAPISVAITNTLLAVLLFGYVIFIDGKQCWNGFTWKVFSNWGPLVQLAIPGLIMVESEFLAYEIMTLASSYLGTNELATQTILSSITSLAYEVPFAIGCAASTRVAGFIGAGSPNAARSAAKVAVIAALCIGFGDGLLILFFRHAFSSLFSSDPAVVDTAAKYIPLCAAMHLLDACGAVLAGISRGQGRQSVGGYVNLAGYYLVGVPSGSLLCFGPTRFGLIGIWMGFIAALSTVVGASWVALRMSDWAKYVLKARTRE